IVNAGLFSRVSSQQQQTAALYRLMIKVNAAPNRRQLAQIIGQELQQMMGAKAAALLINEADRARISVWSTYGEWASCDTSSVALSAHGDPFVIRVLTALHRMEGPGLLVIHNAPQDIKQICNSVNCVTIPLVQTGRIYGLL